MLGFVDKLYHKKISAKGISIFRILFCSTLFFEVVRIFRFRQLYFDPIPFIESSSLDFTYLLLGWMLVLLFLIVGCFTRIAAIINYIIAVFVLNSLGTFEYHMDYSYLGMSFIMILMPMSRLYSFDALLFRKSKWSVFKNLNNKSVSVLYYYVPILVGVGFVYLGSIFFKLKSGMWMGGLGVWLPASLPQMTILNDQWILNQEFFIKFCGYLTVVFEFAFPFLFFIKKARWPLFIIGMILHIGILFEFPIPYFALGVMAIYVLLIPVSTWEAIEKKLTGVLKRTSVKRKENNFYLQSFSSDSVDKYKIVGLKFLLILFSLFQINVMFNFPFSDAILDRISKENRELRIIFQKGKKIKNELARNTSKYFGITVHGVFVDNHFKNHERLYSLKYQDTLLPFYDESGMPDNYLQGGSWINFNFRVNGPGVNQNDENLKNGLMRYSAYWAHKNNVSLQDAEFQIVVKKMKVPFEWEKDLLSKNMTTDWKELGILKWENNKTIFVSTD